TSRAASTTEAPGPERTAATGSSAFVISSVAGISSMPATPSRSARSAGSPKTRTRIPSVAAARAPATTTSGPRSAPRPSRATVTAKDLLLRAVRRLGRGRLADLVLDHLAAGIGPANRADAMRQARAVASGALVEPRGAHLVRGAAL